MQPKNFINRRIIIFLLFLMAFSSTQARYEVSFHITDQNNSLLSGVSIAVYYMDLNTREYVYVGTTTSQSTSMGTWQTYTINAAFDITDNYSPVYVTADKAQTIAIKIGTQVIRMDYGGGAYGDALIIIPYSGAWSINPGNSTYSFTGPQAWHDYQINLSNSMGGDAGPNVQGVIHFNSSNISAGTTATSLY